MNIGDYVRTENGINKIIYIDDIFGSDGKHSFYTIRLDNDNLIYDDEVIKSSPNIIDLIEVGDYVNGFKVDKKYEDRVVINTRDEIIVWFEYQIKSIVTKEMFANAEYRIESEAN